MSGQNVTVCRDSKMQGDRRLLCRDSKVTQNQGMIMYTIHVIILQYYYYTHAKCYNVSFHYKI